MSISMSLQNFGFQKRRERKTNMTENVTEIESSNSESVPDKGKILNVSGPTIDVSANSVNTTDNNVSHDNSQGHTPPCRQGECLNRTLTTLLELDQENTYSDLTFGDFSLTEIDHIRTSNQPSSQVSLTHPVLLSTPNRRKQKRRLEGEQFWNLNASETMMTK